MKKNFKLGVIGAGFMANAIIKGVIDAKVLAPNDIIVNDINESALEKLKNNGLSVTLDKEEVFSNAEFILLAVKPQTFITFVTNESAKKVISIMAGVNKAKIKEKFPLAKVVRCMPNTPVSVGFGAVGIDASDLECEKDVEFVNSLFSGVAKVSFVTEDKLSAITGISGSSPAYFYLFAKSLIEAGVNQGLTEEEAEKMVLATMCGAQKMLENRGEKSIDDLITAVCSKGGTTIEAMKVLNEEKLPFIVDKAVNACVNRVNELEKL